MKRNSKPGSSQRTFALVLVAASLATAISCFTAESSAKGTPCCRNVSVGSMMYHSDMRGMGGVEFEPEVLPPALLFPGSIPNAGLADLEIHGPQYGTSTPLPAPGEATTNSMSSDLDAILFFGPGSEPFGMHIVFGTTYLTTNNSGAQFGPFDTELLSLELSGHHPTLGDVLLRESPTLASTGRLTITPLADGVNAKVESFFDVFFELSIGGAPFVPSDGSLRLYLTNVPEPAAVSLTLLAVAGGSLVIRRRKTVS